MEHDKQVELISAARIEVNDVYDAVRFLQKVERLLVSFLVDERDGSVVELSEH